MGEPNSVFSNALSERFDYGSGSTLAYHGWAAPGSSDDSKVWAICKFIYDSNSNITSVVWAQGQVSFANSWTNRASASYS